MIMMAVVDDDRMLLSGLTAWLANVPDLRLAAAVTSVDHLLDRGVFDIDVVVLGLMPADHCDPAPNVRRIVAAGPKVVVTSVRANPTHLVATRAAGASGFLSKDRDLQQLADLVRDVHSGHERFPVELALADGDDNCANRPKLSGQELRLLLSYAEGMTLDAAARRTGIRPATAKHYLERVKEKYRSAGRPTYTKLDLANRVREDDLLNSTAGPTNRRGLDMPAPMAEFVARQANQGRVT